ncbi:MAG TPA: flagellar hook-length control protein FliK, partial [Bacteroidota bacterium]|nr:flagellar hook-length control protein FliK [Bacteroidota bacterium]
MISSAVLLLPAGEQMDIPGTGGKPPGPDDMSAGGEVFQGVLQQMLYGSTVQTFPAGSAANVDGGSLEPGTSAYSGSGGSAQARLSIGPPVNGPPGLAAADIDLLSEGLLSGPGSAADGIIPAHTADAVIHSAQGLAQNDDRAGNTSGAPPARAGSLQYADISKASVLSGIPDSPKEGDVPLTRVQQDAPAAMKDDVEGRSAHTMIRNLQQSVSSAGMDSGKVAAGTSRTLPGSTAGLSSQEGESTSSAPPDAAGQTVQQVTGGNSTSQENALNNSAGDRNQFFFATQMAATGTADALRSTDPAGRATGMFASLPAETAQSVANQVIKGFMLQMGGDRSELHVKLEPESLGEVVLHVRMEDGKMQAQIDVSQAGV